jgi:hypothetical protein
MLEQKSQPPDCLVLHVAEKPIPGANGRQVDFGVCVSVLSRFFRRPWRLFVTLWAALALVSIAWAGATPLGASPDEPAHIIKAASVARGQLIGEITDKPAVTEVQVPAGIATAHSWPCFAFNATVEAACQSDVSDRQGLATVTTSAGLYNPTYYSLVGWPSLLTDDSSRSVMLMRIASAILVSFFLAVTLFALLRLRPTAVTGIAFLAGATPMCFFLASSVNPNGLEISTGAALTASLLLIVKRGEAVRLRLWLAAIAVSGVLLAQARGLSPLWMAIIALAVLVSSPPKTIVTLIKRKDVLLTLIALAAGVVAAALWLVSTGTLGSMGVFPGAAEVSPIRAFVTMLVDRSFDPGIVGVFGWLDTPAPSFVYVWWSFLGIGLGILPLIVARGRVLAGYGVALAGYFLVPAITQAMSIESSGYIWQGRYTLVGYFIAMIFAAAALGDRTFNMASPQLFLRRSVIVVGSMTVGAQLFAFVVAMKRYVVGADASWVDFVRAPQWLPPLGAWPWVLLLVAGMTVTFVCLYRCVRAETSEQKANGEVAPQHLSR